MLWSYCYYFYHLVLHSSMGNCFYLLLVYHLLKYKPICPQIFISSPFFNKRQHIIHTVVHSCRFFFYAASSQRPERVPVVSFWESLFTFTLALVGCIGVSDDVSCWCLRLAILFQDFCLSFFLFFFHFGSLSIYLSKILEIFVT